MIKMPRKVIERTQRSVNGCNGHPDYLTHLSFVGGIDLSQVKDPLFNRDHLFLRGKRREFLIDVYTCWSLNGYVTTLNALRTEGTKRALRAGTTSELGYLVAGSSEEEALGIHKMVVDTLKETYYFNLSNI